MTPDDEKRALTLAAQATDERLASRAQERLRTRYSEALPAHARADAAAQAMREADEWLYRVEDALAGARLGDDPILVERLEAALVSARAASDAAGKAYDAASRELASAREVGRRR